MDVTLEVMEAVIHGVDGFGVGVHVHGFDVWRFGIQILSCCIAVT